MKTINPHCSFAALLLLAAVFTLAASGGGGEPIVPVAPVAPIAPVPVAKFITVTKPLLPTEFGLNPSRRELALLRKVDVELKSELCADFFVLGEVYYQSNDYLLAEISSTDQAKAEQSGFALASEESLKTNFSNRFDCGRYGQAVADVEPAPPIANCRPITVIKQLPLDRFVPGFLDGVRNFELDVGVTGGSQGVGKTKADLLRKAGVGVKSEVCAGLVARGGRVGNANVVYLLVQISAGDQAKAERLGFALPPEELLKVNFPRPFECASGFY